MAPPRPTTARLLTLAALTALTAATSSTPDCRCFPTEPCWPSTADWAALNATVSGRLVATAPIGSVCHAPNYDAEKCKVLQDSWHDPAAHDESSSSIMAPVWAAQSCDPFTDPSTACELGNYVRYAINVTEPADIAAGIAFAKEHNVRLVVRNTGHDYLGKSTGAGALAVWTHHLKNITYIPAYSGAANWTGAAMKLGAGVQGFEAYRAADSYGMSVVGGECDTVGIAGGYTQGGGHSALMSKYGLAADQVLEWEVVTADGKHRVANQRKNRDLYWALSGGGGGTYGVVTSMTVKAHPDGVTSAARLTFTHDGSAEMVEKWYEALDFFHQMTPSYTDRGAFSVNVYFTGSFSLGPWFGPGLTKAESETLLAPLVAKLDDLELPYTYNMTEFPSYLSAFNDMFDYIAVGIAQYGGRLIPRKTVLENREGLNKAIRGIIDTGSLIFEVTTHPTLEIAGYPDNAVLPAWRDNELNLVVTIPWNDTAPMSKAYADQKTITNVWDAALRELAPDSGVYMNEADPYEPNFQKEFFGANYDRLLKIKDKYDPEHIFYAITAVGSDRWTVEDSGRLCRSG
ncbi:FAD binding domain protein [Morchella snyderi]|nr:FAD binding domain protein [Morchella snyderi]